VCHFVDTCAAIVGADAVDVQVSGSGKGSERLLDDNIVLSLRYPDGSVAAITYASGGHSSTPKERIEILGRGRSAVVSDFRSVSLDGAAGHGNSQDKGHDAAVRAFFEAITAGTGIPSSDIASMRTTLTAADRIR
jgi:predicted dehydrogenase